METPVAEIESWLWHVAARKAIVMSIKGLLGVLAGLKGQVIMAQLGVAVDPQKLEVGLTAFAWIGIDAAHDWAKLKYPNLIKF